MASKEEGEKEKERKKRKTNNESLFSRADAIHRMLMEDFKFLEAIRMSSGPYDPPKLNYGDVMDRESFRDLAVAYPDGLIQYDQFTHRSADRVFGDEMIVPDKRSLHFMVRRSRWPPLGLWAHWIHESTFFTGIMVTVIILNTITIAIDLELRVEEPQLRMFLELLDFIFVCMFVFEIILKWLDDFRGFWDDGWSIFDFLITATSLVGPCVDITFPDIDEEERIEDILNAVRYLRIIRIFRALNVVTKIRKVAQMWAAVVKTFTALIFIVASMLIFFYIFAIIGIQLFDRYTKSHITNLNYRRSFVSLSRAFVTLFQLFTFDHWYDLIKETSKVMGSWTLPLIYILTWMVFAGFIFRNIFVGVMVQNFQSIQQDLTADRQAVTDLKENKKRLDKINLNTLDELETEHISSDDPLVDWESEIFHNLEVVHTLGQKMSPALWPRDTMFQYYMALEAYANNLDERNYIQKLLDRALLRFLDS